jgi:modulator of FtsH protease HflK
MNDHSHPPGEHEHGHTHPAPETPVDAGSQALAEALGSSFAIVKVVMVVLLFVFLGSGFFQVGPQERAIILRFGKPVGEGEKALLGPGLHWSFPYPIDDHEIVSVSGLQEIKSTVGWYATSDVQEAAGTEPPPGPSLNPAAEGYAVTADGNIIHTRAKLVYRIEDPIRYIFSFVNASNLVQNALNNALIQTTAEFRVDDILNAEVTRFRDAVTQRLIRLLDQQNLGIAVDHCEIQSIPPRQLKTAFDQVVSAGQARRTVLNEARRYENQIISKSGADSQSLTNSAETERVSYVRQIASLAGNFERILPEYNKNPQLFAQKSLNETFGRALTNAEKWVLPTAENGKSRELRLLLNREPPKPKAEAQP